MALSKLIEEAKTNFEKTFGMSPSSSAFAPGRVNLLGEHTDYNGGFVLPMPLSLGTVVALGLDGEQGVIQAASTSFPGIDTRRLSDTKQDEWTDYIVGSVKCFLGDRSLETGLKIMVASDLPFGSGLSSSAAIEVATMRAMAKLLNEEINDVDIAKMARRAENEFVGVPCGIMDQYSVSVGTPGTAVFLDTRKLVSKVTELPKAYQFVVVHSGVTHKLSDDGYEKRVAECNAAASTMGVELLSDLSMDDVPKLESLTDPLGKRARHIITENNRVLQAIEALETNDVLSFAKLMIDSHISQRDDYAVSVPEVDALVEGALEAGAVGARLTGGGFGGSIVALVANERLDQWCIDIEANFPDAKVLAIT